MRVDVALMRVVLKALWWRKGVSLAILAVAALSVAAAAVGPLYSRAAEESVLRQALTSVPASGTGVSVGLVGSGSGAPANRLVAQVQDLLDNPDADRYLAAAVVGVQSNSVSVRQGVGSSARSYEVRLASRQGVCGHVRVLSGRCPDGAGQVLVSTRSARALHLAVGSRLGASGLSQRHPVANRPVVVGLYAPGNVADPYWFGQNFFDFGPGRSTAGGDAPDRLDTGFVDQAEMAASELLELRVDVQRALQVSRVRVADLPALNQLLGSLTDQVAQQADPGYQLSVPLQGVLDAVATQLRVVRLLVPLIVAQVVALTWLVLFVLVTRTTQERSAEVALAKLRGLDARRAVTFGLTQPLLLLLLAAPVGLGVGWLAALGLVRTGLPPGTPVALTETVWLSVAVALTGAAVAAVLAARTVLRLPVLAQLLAVPGPGRSRARSGAVDAVVLTLAAAGLYELLAGDRLDPSRPSGLALLVPGLLAAAVALVSVRALPALTLLAARRTRRGQRVAPFLALRQVARRPAAMRIIALLTVAVALATFGVDGWLVAARNRDDRARQEIGAATVLQVRAGTGQRLLSVVRRLDPAGRYAMAVQQVTPDDPTTSGPLVAVDSTRLARVAAWDRSWAVDDVRVLASRLRPALPAPVLLTGSRLTVQTTSVRIQAAASGQSTETPPPPKLRLVVTVQSATVGTRDVAVGALALTGRQTLTAPAPCRAGCRLAGLRVEQTSVVPGDYFGRLLIRGLAMDGRAVPAGLGTRSRWQAPVSEAQLADPTATPPAAIDGASAQGLTVALDSMQGAVPEVTPADTPAALPAVYADGAPRRRYPAGLGTMVAAGLDGSAALVQLRGTASILPRAGRTGVLVDLGYAALSGRAPAANSSFQVWLSPAAPVGFADRLQRAGISTLKRETVPQRRASLGRQGPALALRLFLVASGLALLLGLAAAAVSLYVEARRRSYEIAAMRSLGISRRTLVRAAAAEQAGLLATGALLGTAVGLTSAALALPSVPLYAGRYSGPPLLFAPAWLPLAGLLLAVVAAAALLGYASARRLVASSVPDRLREAQG